MFVWTRNIHKVFQEIKKIEIQRIFSQKYRYNYASSEVLSVGLNTLHCGQLCLWRLHFTDTESPQRRQIVTEAVLLDVTICDQIIPSF